MATDDASVPEWDNDLLLLASRSARRDRQNVGYTPGKGGKSLEVAPSTAVSGQMAMKRDSHV